jgi:hypothetical protein
MPAFTADQKNLMMLWTMLTTNNQLYKDVKPVSASATDDVAKAAAAPVLGKLTSLGPLDLGSQSLVTASVRHGYFEHFQALRTLYQGSAQKVAGWGGSSQDHPPLTDLKSQFDK